MKTKILGFLAVGLLAGPMAANAVVVTVSGAKWDITTQTGTFTALEDTLDGQPWWGDVDLAKVFARSYQAAVGNYGTGPKFAYEETVVNNNPSFKFVYPWCDGLGGSPANDCYKSTLSAGASFTFAIASEVAVPEPGTLALLGLGLAGLGLSRRRKTH